LLKKTMNNERDTANEIKDIMPDAYSFGFNYLRFCLRTSLN